MHGVCFSTTDVEGNEYEVLADMVLSGVYCSIHTIYIEWHDWPLGTNVTERATMQSEDLTKFLTGIVAQIPGCNTR